MGGRDEDVGGLAGCHSADTAEADCGEGHILSWAELAGGRGEGSRVQQQQQRGSKGSSTHLRSSTHLGSSTHLERVGVGAAQLRGASAQPAEAPQRIAWRLLPHVRAAVAVGAEDAGAAWVPVHQARQRQARAGRAEAAEEGPARGGGGVRASRWWCCVPARTCVGVCAEFVDLHAHICDRAHLVARSGTPLPVTRMQGRPGVSQKRSSTRRCR